MNDGKVAQIGRPRICMTGRPAGSSRRLHRRVHLSPAIVRGMEDGVVLAECAVVLTRAICPARPASGEKVTLTTRPERLRFADNPATNSATTQNRMSVTVTEAVFAGERCRYLLQAADGTPMVLKEPSSAAIRRRSVGERAEIAWSVADTILV